MGMYFDKGKVSRPILDKIRSDVIFDDNITEMETGNFTDWRRYHDDYFLPVNTLFEESQGVEFRKVREQFNLNMQMVTQWKPWGPCEVCGRPQNDGIRRKMGFCRIKLRHYPNTDKSNLNLNDSDVTFLLNSNAVACRSQLLSRVLPTIGNLTRVIPNFIQTEKCEGTCNPDAEGVGRGWKSTKKRSYKYRKTFVLAENAHLTIVCPEATLDSEVVWKKNGEVLEAGESVVPPKPEDEPRIIVDTFNTLYLVGVKDSEAGNYTCEVDKVRMEQVVVFVISKSKILTQAFIRHTMYLGFVLSLTTPCYVAGLIIACTRKRYFKGYEQLKESEIQKGYFHAHLQADDAV